MVADPKISCIMVLEPKQGRGRWRGRNDQDEYTLCALFLILRNFNTNLSGTSVISCVWSFSQEKTLEFLSRV